MCELPSLEWLGKVLEVLVAHAAGNALASSLCHTVFGTDAKSAIVLNLTCVGSGHMTLSDICDLSAAQRKSLVRKLVAHARREISAAHVADIEAKSGSEGEGTSRPALQCESKVQSKQLLCV